MHDFKVATIVMLNDGPMDQVNEISEDNHATAIVSWTANGGKNCEGFQSSHPSTPSNRLTPVIQLRGDPFRQ